MKDRFVEDRAEDMLTDIETFLTERLGLDWSFNWSCLLYTSPSPRD